MKLLSDFAIGITHCTIMLAIVTVFTVLAGPVDLIEALEQIQKFGLILTVLQSGLVLIVVLPLSIRKLGVCGLKALGGLIAITWLGYFSILGLCVKQTLEFESLVGVAGSVFLGWVLGLIAEPQEEGAQTQTA